MFRARVCTVIKNCFVDAEPQRNESEILKVRVWEDLSDNNFYAKGNINSDYDEFIDLKIWVLQYLENNEVCFNHYTSCIK